MTRALLSISKASKCVFPCLGEGQSFEELNFRMADVSYFKSNERSNVDRPILQE